MSTLMPGCPFPQVNAYFVLTKNNSHLQASGPAASPFRRCRAESLGHLPKVTKLARSKWTCLNIVKEGREVGEKEGREREREGP